MKHRYTDDDDGGNRDRGKQLWGAISPRLIRVREIEILSDSFSAPARLLRATALLDFDTETLFP